MDALHGRAERLKRPADLSGILTAFAVGFDFRGEVRDPIRPRVERFDEPVAACLVQSSLGKAADQFQDVIRRWPGVTSGDFRAARLPEQPPEGLELAVVRRQRRGGGEPRRSRRLER